MVVGKFHCSWGIISEAQKINLENFDARGVIVPLYTKNGA
jgi:hypothetical protein